MSKLMKRYLLLLIAGLALVATAEAGTTKFDSIRAGNDLTVVDDVTVGGDVAVTGTIASSTQTIVAVGGAVQVSTATTSTAKLCLAGAFASLPTGGYAKGCIAYLTSDNKVYVSTETVAGTQSWQAVGGQ